MRENTVSGMPKINKDFTFVRSSVLLVLIFSSDYGDHTCTWQHSEPAGNIHYGTQ